MSPRPILKRAAAAPAPAPTHPHTHQHHYHHPFPFAAPAVHFPPNPALTRTFSAYSAAAYDRSPIVVAPNSCALPERGCPGRTYTLDESSAAAPAPRCITSARDYHPRALAFASASNPAAAYAPVPALIFDMSSESEESDGVAAQPPTPSSSSSYHSYPPSMAMGSPSKSFSGFHASPTSNNTLYAEDEEADEYDDEDHDPARAYRLRGGAPMYPPSGSPTYASYGQSPAAQNQPHRRRRDRRHESSRDPDRIPGGEALSLASLSISSASSSSAYNTLPTSNTISSSNTFSYSLSPPPSPAYPTHSPSSSPARKKGVPRQPRAVLPPPPPQLGGGFGMDDGCLGGF